MLDLKTQEGRFNKEQLRVLFTNLLVQYSVKRSHAQILIDSMISADSTGVHTHGLTVLPAYLDKIKKGGFNLTEDAIIQKETDAFCVIDANNQIGAVSADRCIKIAIEKATKSGMYTVFCNNANTFGAASYYVRQATKQKMVAVCFSNSPSAMAPWGGKTKMLGTNPLAIGIPAKNKADIIVDMATSIVAKSKINEIRKQGGTLPDGWALDPEGNPTNDPLEAIKGMVLPMAQHKGYAIAMAIDVLSGVLSGAGYLNNINRFYSQDNKCMNVGQCFTVINPQMVLDESFCDKIDDYIQQLHTSGKNVRYPGETGAEKMEKSEKEGIDLSPETVEALLKMLNEN